MKKRLVQILVLQVLLCFDGESLFAMKKFFKFLCDCGTDITQVSDPGYVTPRNESFDAREGVGNSVAMLASASETNVFFPISSIVHFLSCPSIEEEIETLRKKLECRGGRNLRLLFPVAGLEAYFENSEEIERFYYVLGTSFAKFSSKILSFEFNWQELLKGLPNEKVYEKLVLNGIDSFKQGILGASYSDVDDKEFNPYIRFTLNFDSEGL